MTFDLMFSKYTTYAETNTKEGIDSGISEEEFIKIIKLYPQFECAQNTIFNEIEYLKLSLSNLREADVKNIQKANSLCFLLNYNENKAIEKYNKDSKWNYSHISWHTSIVAHIVGKENYEELKLFYDIAKKLNLNLLTYDGLITEAYLEALRIKEENRGIKLTKEQSHVLSSVEDQCRWWYVPTDDVAAVFTIFGIEPALKEADITGIIDDVQFENKIAVASLTGHTILFGLNAPYIVYPNLNAYLDIKDQHTPHLQNTLNKLSKAFGTAAYFEYNNDDEMIASLAWSSKGKFVYGRFTSEGEGTDVFGTQKKPMEVNQKTILKTAKKLGMTPEDILTGLMKQKMPVRYFVQPHWYIESNLKK